MSQEMKKYVSSVFAASLVMDPLPKPPAEAFADRKPSGKDRSKVKAARKQSKKARRKNKK